MHISSILSMSLETLRSGVLFVKSRFTPKICLVGKQELHDSVGEGVGMIFCTSSRSNQLIHHI